MTYIFLRRTRPLHRHFNGVAGWQAPLAQHSCFRVMQTVHPNVLCALANCALSRPAARRCATEVGIATLLFSLSVGGRLPWTRQPTMGT